MHRISKSIYLRKRIIRKTYLAYINKYLMGERVSLGVAAPYDMTT